jgi:hypothetical protein
VVDGVFWRKGRDEREKLIPEPRFIVRGLEGREGVFMSIACVFNDKAV